MKYGYCRVSTKLQARDGNSLEAQEKALTEQGAEIIFKDSFTGTKMERPAFTELLGLLQSDDTLIVTKLDRIARSAVQGMQVIEDLQRKGVTIHILNMGIIDNSPTGKLIRNIFLSFAEFERDMIVERTQEGKAIAKQRPDYHEGRPVKYDEDQIQNALELLEKYSYTKVTKLTGISKSFLVRAKRKQKGAAEL